MVRWMFPPASGRTASPTAPAQTSSTTRAPEVRASGSPAAEGAGDRRAKPRDPFLDNVKFLTILLVGLGHAWAPLTGENRSIAALYLFVYAFHMPAFVLVSGYLSRSFEARPGQVRRLITGVAVPYAVFEVVYTLFMRQIADPDRPLSFFSPGYALWFLVALFIWRLTAPVWKLLRWPLPVALALAAVASATPGIGGELNLMRVLQFLPFFVLGLHLRREHFDLVRTRTARLVAAPVALGFLAFAYWAAPAMDDEWLLHTSSAQELGAPWWAGPVMTLAIFGCALALTACLVAWTPGRTTWFTALGAGTIFAYLLHVYLVQAAREFDWYALSGADTPLGHLVISLLALVMMTALCAAPVRRLFRPVVEPRMDWFFRDTPGKTSPEKVNATVR